MALVALTVLPLGGLWEHLSTYLSRVAQLPFEPDTYDPDGETEAPFSGLVTGQRGCGTCSEAYDSVGGILFASIDTRAGAEDSEDLPAAQPVPAGRPQFPPYDPGPYGGDYFNKSGAWVLDVTPPSSSLSAAVASFVASVANWLFPLLPIGDATQPFDFEQEWTGEDSYVFFSFTPADPASMQTWFSWPGNYRGMLDASPENVHYFWLSDYDGYSQFDCALIKLYIEVGTYLFLSPYERRHWRSRMHFGRAPCSEAATPSFAQAVCGHAATSIDRFQRWRQTGYLGNPATFAGWFTSYLAHEPIYFNSEFDGLYQPDLAYDEITVFDRQRYVGGWSMAMTRAVQLPANLSVYDGLSVELLRGCPDSQNRYRDESCDPYDRLSHLSLCDAAGSDCREIARWVTPFARQPHHLSDISPMLAQLSPGARPVLKYQEKGQSKGLLTLRLRLHRSARSESGSAPSEAPSAEGASAEGEAERSSATAVGFVDAWAGTLRFNPSYGALRGGVDFYVPREARRVELVAYISGHGWGSTGCANCAEFCNSRHVFELNGGSRSFEEAFPEAVDSTHCLDPDVIATGVIPNQWGTWGYGRAGWCPGLDVPPHRIDLTDAVIPGTNNTMSYSACLVLGDGSCVAPCECSDGYCPEIAMGSYIVFYE